MVTHLELDILECEVKGALGNITGNKTRGGDGILAELFKILKMTLSIHQQNAAVAMGLEMVSFHFNPKGQYQKCSNYHTFALISHDRKIMFKILQARLSVLHKLRISRCISWL